MRWLLFFCASLFAAALYPTAGTAADAASPWVRTDYTQVRLVSAVTAVGEDRAEVPLGLHFKLKEGWKIYWRSPGDAGFPPRLDWSDSTNIASADLQWPAPKRFSVLGFDTQGYQDEVVLPVKARLAESGKPASIKAKLDYLACKEICIPFQTALTLNLPTGAAQPSRQAHLINRFQSLVPRTDANLGLTVQKAVAALSSKKPALIVSATSHQAFSQPDLFVEGPRELQFGKPVVELGPKDTSAEFRVPIFGLKDLTGGAETLRKRPLTFTLIDGTRGTEARLSITSGQAAAPSTRLFSSAFLQILLFALLGGLILNLMPCVLPVLSIKLLSVVGHGGRELRHVRMSFIASAAGIVVSFLILAGGLLALKVAGMSIGWGIQFQHPWFLVAMAAIITLFACNLWGFFEISLPRWIADMGEHTGHAEGLGGHFLTGMLATLLATPCSAPFLGTAVGFALSRGAVEILIIFAALGIGLALPYLLIAAAPALATRLPRPGRWMLILKRILGFALAATAVWLLSVLDTLVGLTATLSAAFFLTLCAALLYFHHRRGAPSSVATWHGAVVFVVLAFVAPVWFAGKPTGTLQAAEGSQQWRPFEESAIHRFVDRNKVVFVDVTADWCITCKANKTLVVDSAPVQRYFADKDIMTMQADWTRPDETIAAYLAKFGRYGIPFNVVYGPGAPEGIVLPELLTKTAVLNALEKARPKATAAKAER